MQDIKFRVWDSDKRQFSSFSFDDVASMATFLGHAGGRSTRWLHVPAVYRPQ